MHANRLAARQTSRQTLMEADTENWGVYRGPGIQRRGLTNSKDNLNAIPASSWMSLIFIRLYPIGVKWEKGTVWPSSFGSAITADIWICGQADWLHSKHQLKGYSWWIITSCVPGRIANCSRRTMNNNRVSCLFTKSEWHPDPLLRPLSQELQKLQSEIVNTNTFLLMYQLQLGNVWCNFYN